MKRIFAALLAVMLLISAFAGCYGETAQEEKNKSSVALKVGEREYTVEDMDYMYVSSFNEVYNSFYSYYGDYISSLVDISKPLEEQMIGENETWHDYVKKLAVDTVKSMTAIYEEALANGYVLEEAYQQDLDTIEEQLEEIASGMGMTSEEYLKASYGETVGLETIKKMTELQIYCNAYVQDYKEGIEVSEDEILAYYEANKNNIDTVDFRYYTTFYGEAEGETLTKEEAEEKAKLLSETKTAEEFNALAKEFTTDEEQKKLFDESDATLFPGAGYSSTGIDEVSEWLFEEGRKQGDTMIYHDEGYQSFITIMFEKRVDPDYDYIDVRHILLVPPAEEGATPSEQAWIEAESRANYVLDNYLAGEMTEEAFGELAKEYSADGNAAQGGIYENVRKGQMVQTFNDWCFDEARNPGDTGIVKTPYGYHVMYFVGTGDNNLVATIEPAVVQEKLTAFLTECEGKLDSEETDAMADVGGMIDDVVAEANKNAMGDAEVSETEKETRSFTGIIIGVLVAVIIVCIIIIAKGGSKKKTESEEADEETAEAEEPVLEATDEDLTEEELLAEEAFEENVSEEETEE